MRLSSSFRVALAISDQRISFDHALAVSLVDGKWRVRSAVRCPFSVWRHHSDPLRYASAGSSCDGISRRMPQSLGACSSIVTFVLLMFGEWMPA
jgi:hypothetical protein